MSNLIVTIISIALVAVTSVMVLSYGGAAYTSYTSAARANMLISQTKQVYQAATQYMLDKGFTSFNDFKEDDPGLAGYLQSRVPILNLNTVAVSTSSAPFVTNNSSSYTNDTLDGITVSIRRSNCQISGINKVTYQFSTSSTDFSAAAQINHPIVQMCLKLNAFVKFPTGYILAASGLPYGQGSASTCNGNYYHFQSGDGYCYLRNTGGSSPYVLLHFSN